MSNVIFWLGILVFLAGAILFWSRHRRQRTLAALPTLPRLGWSSLQIRMGCAYMWTNTLFFVVMLIIAVLASFRTVSPDATSGRLSLVARTAWEVASEISTQAGGKPLLPYDSYHFPPQGTALSIALTSQEDASPHLFALLVAPDDHIFASSAPFLYPNGSSFSHLMPDKAEVIQIVLVGINTSQSSRTGDILYAMEPVWSSEHRVIGVVYVQAARSAVPDPPPDLSQWTLLTTLFGIPFAVLFMLLIFMPLGGIFGLLTSRKLAHRLRELAQVTITLANGNYHLRVPVRRKDEVGILEEQFNRMAQRLAESREREQELITQNVRMDERGRISRELHDSIAQNLFSLSLLTEGIQSALPDDSPLRAKVTLLDNTAEMMTREMRALLLELRPIRLEEVGLKEALEELAAAYTTRLNLSIVTEITTNPLPGELEHALLRITQEALSNAVRHAQATKITIILTSYPQSAVLSIQDDGTGFQFQEKEAHHGLGLRLMEERAQELGGTMKIQSQQGSGTRIQIHLPLVHEAARNEGAI